jgi:hypothetical protein
MSTFFSRIGLGTKLSLLTGTSVAVLFLVFTFLLSNKASQQLETLAVEDLHNQSTGVQDMVEMFNSSLSEEVESYTRLFNSFLPQPVTLDQSQRRDINGISVPLLKGGDSDLHENNTLVDDFLTRTGAIATLFVRSGDDFVRVATSLRKENGDRAIGTKLDKASPAFAPALKGETYRGLALLFGKRYITQYQPVKDSSGNTIAILFVGVDITHSWEIMRSKILGRQLGDSGHFYVLDRNNGKNYGNYLFHPSEEGKRPQWDERDLNTVLQETAGTLEQQRPDGHRQMLSWITVPGWNWTVVGEVDKAVLLNDVNTLRNQFLIAGLALSLLFAALFVVIVRRWLTRPCVMPLAWPAVTRRATCGIVWISNVRTKWGNSLRPSTGSAMVCIPLFYKSVNLPAIFTTVPMRLPPTAVKSASKLTSRPAASRRRQPAWSNLPRRSSRMPPVWKRCSRW